MQLLFFFPIKEYNHQVFQRLKLYLGLFGAAAGINSEFGEIKIFNTIGNSFTSTTQQTKKRTKVVLKYFAPRIRTVILCL